MIFESLKTEGPEYKPEQHQSRIDFTDKPLPEGSLSLKEWVEFGTDMPEEIVPVLEYVYNRGYNPLDGNFYWSPSPGYEQRVIVPFVYQGRIVGNTARKIVDGRPKYLSDQHPHFVFNVDAQQEEPTESDQPTTNNDSANIISYKSNCLRQCPVELAHVCDKNIFLK
jgi:hypothetical protein